MRQSLSKVAAALSLLLCIATTAVWIGSYHWSLEIANWSEQLPGGEEPGPYCILLERDRVTIQSFDEKSEKLNPYRAPYSPHRLRFVCRFYATEPNNLEGWRWWLAYSRSHLGSFAIPYWVLIFATAILPMRSGWRWWKRRNAIVHGVCTGCGYDLRA